MESKVIHLFYCPFTGLGLYGGFRGNRWLKNRIKIFKQFVIPSLLAQTDKNFVLWISWRWQEKSNPQVKELKEWLNDNTNLNTVFTFSGLCFWDDKNKDEDEYPRLVNALHLAIGELLNVMSDETEVLMTIQPSDDFYWTGMVEETKRFFRENPKFQVYGYQKGYVMNYLNLDIAEWNPTTTPPFYTIKFPREVFTNHLKHVSYTGPYKSHEYVRDHLISAYNLVKRGFVVGTHGENISTVFNHPFAQPLKMAINLKDFAIDSLSPLKISLSLRKILMRRLPHGWQRKLRYWLGERFYSKIYDWIRN